MFGMHVPDAVTCIANFDGWHRLLTLFMPGRQIAQMYYRLALKQMYANRSWPEKPVLLWLPNGQIWRVYEDGTVTRFTRDMVGPKKLEG